MPKPASILFLGTSSGGGPTASRSCSSLAITYENRACLVDCGEGTYRQLVKFGFKTSRIDTIFITHMHGDHVLGLVPLLANLLSGVNNTVKDLDRFKKRSPDSKPAIQIYSPPGLRLLIRMTLSLTDCVLGRFYAVHELLRPEDEITPCHVEEMHINELPGRDIRSGGDSVGMRDPFWKDVLGEKGGKKGWEVNAGKIEHRVTSLAYAVTFPRTPLPLPPTHLQTLQANNLPASLLGPHLASGEPIVLPDGKGTLEHPGWERGFKLAVLGDTNDANGSREICDGADVLIHECTNAYIPPPSSKPRSSTTPSSSADPCPSTSSLPVPAPSPKPPGQTDLKPTKNGKPKNPSSPSSSSPETAAAVTRLKAQARGHSMPLDAGAFAASISARHVLLNHFSPMFSHPDQMREIERQTVEAIDCCSERPLDPPRDLPSLKCVQEEGRIAQRRTESWTERVVKCAEDGMRVELKVDGGIEIIEWSS